MADCGIFCSVGLELKRSKVDVLSGGRLERGEDFTGACVGGKIRLLSGWDVDAGRLLGGEEVREFDESGIRWEVDELRLSKKIVEEEGVAKGKGGEFERDELGLLINRG